VPTQCVAWEMNMVDGKTRRTYKLTAFRNIRIEISIGRIRTFQFVMGDGQIRWTYGQSTFQKIRIQWRTGRIRTFAFQTEDGQTRWTYNQTTLWNIRIQFRTGRIRTFACRTDEYWNNNSKQQQIHVLQKANMKYYVKKDVINSPIFQRFLEGIVKRMQCRMSHDGGLILHHGIIVHGLWCIVCLGSSHRTATTHPLNVFTQVGFGRLWGPSCARHCRRDIGRIKGNSYSKQNSTTVKIMSQTTTAAAFVVAFRGRSWGSLP